MLAEKLNVSRQSVSKWESGSSIPGIDKILKISRIYGISTDYLLKDEMEELPEEVVADVYQPEDVREISVETATEYLSAISDGAGRIALGVSLCILSPVPLFIFSGMSEAGLIFPTEDAAGGVGTGVLQQGDYTIEKKRENKRMEVFGGVYWEIITAVYLGISFFVRTGMSHGLSGRWQGWLLRLFGRLCLRCMTGENG